MATMTAPNSRAAARAMTPSRQIQVIAAHATRLTVRDPRASVGTRSVERRWRRRSDGRARSASASRSAGARTTPRGGSSWPARSRTSATRRSRCPITSAQQLAPVPALMAAAAATERPAHRRPRVRQRLQASRRARQGAGHDGRAVGRSARDRHRRRVDGDRLRGVGHRRTTARACASTASRRRSRSSRARCADGPFSFAGEHYTITDYDGQPQARAAAAPAAAHRRRWAAGAVDRRPRGRHRRHQRDAHDRRRSGPRRWRR